MADNQKQYITPETKAKLEEELNALIAHRPVVAAEINERREEGDLKENAGYDAAREMQDQEEARIKQISEILANSTTERAGIVEGVAHIGSVVHVYYNGDKNDKETFLIGTRAAASDNKDLETYSEQSPLGAAVVGAQEGETRQYSAPNGNTISVTIVSAEPYDSSKAATPRNP
ncbi:transcription elongation factor GreA [Corynebacterium belfantii]|uniref:Transcription elongation factor GreA n=1 Tax=Corynebacterium belfantii TaxID=2014537 RepID=A0ABS0L8N4_9CORY|nr:transcription elongation factor GreA [Corynebacterium belfantii]OLN17241.1 transcription elongation factor GreA [Corynebacterium diphtheriae subsp. lausannense]QVI97909.1 transcription elongation factor GreA [Corynebacterium diphtheriae]MBG9242772.1 transcription elongation factor GreA [Corynebacterium belfantii]MBG9258131.1 transcription elongation factor GreA [Corynebacterium belfantii]MBG9264631.1 transcription elongation factor GreA [Corynebacterium belfantii]